MSRRNLKVMPTEPGRAQVESLDHDGRGVAHVDGKAVFIEGTLPGEEVLFRYVTQRKRFDEGVVSEIITASPHRVEPRCPHFGVCGGCSLQHMAPEAQIQSKQRLLLDNLWHIGRVKPETILEPLTGPAWGYRRKARMGAKYVEKKASMLVGFREKRSGFLADLRRCEVLHPSVGEHINDLRVLIEGMHARDRIPQVEVAVSDSITALVFRHLVPLQADDLARLRAFGEHHGIHIYLQPQGPDSMYLLWPELPVEQTRLTYRLDVYDVELTFRPTDFTQVNFDINRKMIDHALGLLDPQPQDRVLDLFCGLGNFTLPLARRAGQVVGVEGDALLVQRARENAEFNKLDNVEFHAANLTLEPHAQPWYGRGFDKILLDPPRTGALEIVRHLPAFNAPRIVYVSCNPATLARDAQALAEAGYVLRKAGAMDMFPHTTHVESIALFEKRG